MGELQFLCLPGFLMGSHISREGVRYACKTAQGVSQGGDATREGLGVPLGHNVQILCV